jgi:outer membrane protein TolC
MVEGSINLPWLNRRKHDAEISEAKAQVSEQDAELAALRNSAFGQIQEALAQVRSAWNIHRSLHPLAAQRQLLRRLCPLVQSAR